MFRSTFISLLTLVACSALLTQATGGQAPGRPGLDAHWPSAAKNGFGTANTLASKVWFTLNGGVMTEVFYPTLDAPNVQTLQLLIVGDRVETESEDTNHRLELLDPRALSFRQVNTAKSGEYTITKTYVTDPNRHTVLIDVEISSRTVNHFYVYYDPSLNNSGMYDSAWSEGDALLAVDGNKASALVSSSGFASPGELATGKREPADRPAEAVISNGYLGKSDFLTELKSNASRARLKTYPRAQDGNVVQVAALSGFHGARSESAETTRGQQPGKFRCTIALAFGKTPREALTNARASLAKGFDAIRKEYEAGWHKYLKPLRRVELRYQSQFNMAALVLKALEDKTHRGAMIASPSSPWGGGPNANEPTISGYHAVWSRDLYQVATAFLAMGDRASANRALDYLFKVQQRRDGSFPQNSWVDGHPIGSNVQMDQTGLPLVLAFQLERTDRRTWLKHIKPAADFIVRTGPTTVQDRWEEKSGYSPSTMAAEIAGLVCAARVAGLHKDKTSRETYLKTADEWVRQLEYWTATSNGRLAKNGYYIRITENDDPNDGAKIEINSGGGVYDEREIVDAGFLELVRLGIKPPGDPLIHRTLAVVDRLIKVETRGGPGWYRYNHDAYGERPDGGNYDGRKGVGRLWALLTGERGEYDVARGDLGSARKRLDAMMAFANDGMMIPEQVWDRKESPRSHLRFGEGTGAATPLAWSMAQFIRLAMNIKHGRNVETPRIVAARYLKTREKKNVPVR